MSGFRLSLGTFFLIVSTVAIGDAARRLACRLWPGEWVAAGAGALVFALSAIVLVLELLGSAGLLHPVPVLVVSCIGWVAAFVALRHAETQLWVPARYLDVWPGHRYSTAAFVGLVGVLALFLLATTVWAVGQPRPEFDVVAGHLPVAVQWFQAGSTWVFPYSTPITVQAHYPGNSELLALWLALPVSRDYLVQLASVPGVMLLVLGVILAATNLGARMPAAIVAGLAVPTLPQVLGPLVGTNMQDMLTLGGLAAMAGFVARDGVRPTRANLVAAGLAGGLALGARYGALGGVPLLGCLGLLQRGLLTRHLAALVRAGAILTAAILVAGGYFYLRNLLVAGDPLYPASLPGFRVFPVEREIFYGLRSYIELGWAPAQWRRGVSLELRYYGPVALLVLSAMVVAPALAVARRERKVARWGWALLPAAIFITFVAQVGSAGGVTPAGNLDPDFQAIQLRYALLTMPVAAAVLAAEGSRLSGRIERVVLIGVLGAAAVCAQLLTTNPIPGRYLLVAAVAAPVLLTLLAIVPRHLTVVGAPSAAVLVILVAAPALAGHYDRGRTASGMPFEVAATYLPRDDTTVAISGVCQLYAFYGPAWSRRVEYLTGRDYGIDRPMASSYAEWLQSLRQHGVSSLVIGSDLCFRRLGNPQGRWAAQHPEVFRVLYTDGDTTIYNVNAG